MFYILLIILALIVLLLVREIAPKMPGLLVGILEYIGKQPAKRLAILILMACGVYFLVLMLIKKKK